MAKILSIQPTGNWRDLFKFEVSLDNGVTGTVFSKSETFRFTIGQDVAHELNEKGTLKLQKPEYAGQSYSAPSNSYAPKSNTGNSSKDELIVRQVALKAAVEFVAAKGGTEAQVLTVAQIFNDWVLEKAPTGRSHSEHFTEENPF